MMLNKLLVTTALVTLMSTAAMADNATTTSTQGSNTTNATTTQGTSSAQAGSIRYMTAQEANGHLASKLIGMNVYSGNGNSNAAATSNTMATSSNNTQGTSTDTTQDTTAQANNSQGSSNNNQGASTTTQGTVAQADVTGESIGEINDLVIGNDGSVKAVVVGVGGFLGMGEKNVAIPFDEIHWSNSNGNQTPTAVVMASKETLKSAPAFDTKSADTMANANNMNANGTTTSDNMAANTTADTTNNTSATNSNGTVTTNGVTANADNQNLTPAKDEMLSADNLTNRTVYSADNQNIGEVGDVLLTKDGKIAAVVLDVGGFLGIGEKPVAISFKDLKVMSDQSNNLYLYTKFTKDQLESAPTFNRDTYSSNPDSVILRSGS